MSVDTSERCDAIIMHITVRLNWRGRIRALFGREIHVHCYGIERLVDRPDVLAMLNHVESFTAVDRLWIPRRNRTDGYAREEKP